jgi:glycosyltransferase involved in cell wall biosynthesis
MLIYEEMLLSTLRRSGLGIVDLWYPEAILSGLAPGPTNKFLRKLDKYFLGPARLPHTTILHLVDHSYAYFLLRCRHDVAISTCHDMIPFLCRAGELSGWRPSRAYCHMMDQIAEGLQSADRIIAVSKATRKDLVRVLGISDARIKIIPNCLTNFPHVNADDVKAVRNMLSVADRERIVLCFSGKFYKNASGSLRMFAGAGRRFKSLKLVVMNAERDQLAREAAGLGIADQIIFAPRLSRVALGALYKTTSALLFPSLYEGFGWPVLEAQHWGVPVIASRLGAVEEVAGAGAVTVDPEDDGAGAKALCRVLEDETFAASLIRSGRHNLSRFTRQRWDEALLDVYAELGISSLPCDHDGAEGPGVRNSTLNPGATHEGL